ncbi:acyltransferase [Companilactobacillus sp. RD055328]|uniref:acyltransferase n=1 Tax=Companilactobacillus sp. RD055328 TaxID=2916634 RepID=UPI001FC7D242|nr:acyltransferase [Companilactobacillus sp. RD055328]GKQ42397.1 acyltransferase [Companilactobacillus sp. RD055328]
MVKKIDTRFNLLRVMAMIFVVCIHTLGLVFPGNVNYIWSASHEVLITILFICNPIFFMMSGHFNLHYKGSSRKDYVLYLKKKAMAIVLPLIIYEFIYYVVLTIARKDVNSLGSFVQGFFINTLQEFTNTYFWFMYVLIGLLIAAPFFSKMIDNLNQSEKTSLLITSIVIQLLIMICQFGNINLGISGYPFISWIFYFILGRLLEDISLKSISNPIKLGVLLLIMIVNIITNRLFPNVLIHDQAPTNILFVVIIYMSLLDSVVFNKLSSNKIVAFLSKYSFSLYLSHGVFLIAFANVRITNYFVIQYLALIIMVSVSALFFGFLVDNIVVNPIKKIINNRIKK